MYYHLPFDAFTRGSCAGDLPLDLEQSALRSLKAASVWIVALWSEYQ